MKLLRCNAGHYYDAETFASCPHCTDSDRSSATIESVTVASRPLAIDATVAPTAAPTANTGWAQIPRNFDPGMTVPLDVSGAVDNDATVGVYTRKDTVMQPVAGWLVCVQGPSLGRDYRLVAGRNSIGRDSSNPIAINEDRSISRAKHAVVTYDPHSNSFFIQPGESSELCYVNREVVLESMPLKTDDIITVGKTSLMFLPCCSDRFTWDLLTNGGNADV